MSEPDLDALATARFTLATLAAGRALAVDLGLLVGAGHIVAEPDGAWDDDREPVRGSSCAAAASI